MVTSRKKKLSDYEKLNQIKIPISELRQQLAQLYMEGFKEIPLGDLLYIIRKTVPEKGE